MGKYCYFIFILIFIELYSLSNEDNLKADEKEDDIIILHTNDVHCGLLDNIGYDGLMLYKRELQESFNHVLTVDVGDHLQGDTIGFLSKGIAVTEIMNKIGYDVAILGNHEFDYGMESLINCSEALNCGYTCANFGYRKNKTSIFPEYKIINVTDDKKIAFIGVLTPYTLLRTDLSTIFEDNGTLVYDLYAENDGKDLYEQVQKIIDEVKETEGADYVIILSHLGNEAEALYNSSWLISKINGVDAVLDAHSHKEYSEKVKDKDGKDILLVQTGTKLNKIGVLKIKDKDNIISELISEVPTPEEDIEGAKTISRNNKERWVDEEMNKFINEKINEYSEKLNTKIGTAKFDLNINIDSSGNPTLQKSRKEENTLCNLVADAIRDAGKGEITLIPAGNIRDDLKAGDITYKTIFDILPYSNSIIVKEVLGQDILDALEYGMRLLPRPSSKFLQVSGISFKVNTNIESPIVEDENEIFISVNGERRVYDVKVGDKKLDPQKIYTMSFDNYIGKGGDGYSMFLNSKYEIKRSTQKLDNQILIDYIQTKLKGEIPDTYKKTQGRITIISNKEEDGDDDDDDDNKYLYGIIIALSVVIIILFALLIYTRCKKNNNEISSGIENVDGKLIQNNEMN